MEFILNGQSFVFDEPKSIRILQGYTHPNKFILMQIHGINHTTPFPERNKEGFELALLNRRARNTDKNFFHQAELKWL